MGEIIDKLVFAKTKRFWSANDKVQMIIQGRKKTFCKKRYLIKDLGPESTSNKKGKSLIKIQTKYRADSSANRMFGR